MVAMRRAAREGGNQTDPKGGDHPLVFKSRINRHKDAAGEKWHMDNAIEREEKAKIITMYVIAKALDLGPPGALVLVIKGRRRIRGTLRLRSPCRDHSSCGKRKEEKGFGEGGD